MALGALVLVLWSGGGDDRVGAPAPIALAFGPMQLAWKLGVVMVIALVLVVLPGGGNALDVVLALLTSRS